MIDWIENKYSNRDRTGQPSSQQRMYRPYPINDEPMPIKGHFIWTRNKLKQLEDQQLAIPRMIRDALNR